MCWLQGNLQFIEQGHDASSVKDKGTVRTIAMLLGTKESDTEKVRSHRTNPKEKQILWSYVYSHFSDIWGVFQKHVSKLAIGYFYNMKQFFFRLWNLC